MLIAGTATAAEPSAAEQLAGELVDGKYDAVAARFDSNLRAKIGPAQLQAVMDPLRTARGPAKELHVASPSGATTYVDVTWHTGAPSQITIATDSDGRVAGLWIRDRPAQPTNYETHYETKAALRPPFRGTWTAMNANRDASNPHFTNANQQYAVDWLIVAGGNGKSFRTDGKRNDDYYAYGQDALAPAAGVVVTVIDGVPENPHPGDGEGDRYNVTGNQIVLDLGGGEWALFAHLIPGSMRVHAGDRVTAGQPLAKIGNSGHSTEPHLHFQLMDAPRLTDAHALPAKFARATVNGKVVTRAWPVTGDRVAP
ncbi:MAG TPA: M23 family metallopeptidase [Polyangia bacterium]|jgi:murein DD-endopeptidase MepM/ murein hydrolase activator NlpD|nr:M23 family metallopeptidase [Polyangia bacterium]